MGDNKENIDKLFSSGFQGFEADTPHDGWQAVKAKIFKSKKKRRALIIRWSMVSIALILAFFAGFNIQNWNPKNNPTPSPDGIHFIDTNQGLNKSITNKEEIEVQNSKENIADHPSSNQEVNSGDENFKNENLAISNNTELASGENKTLISNSKPEKLAIDGFDVKRKSQNLIDLSFLTIPIGETENKLSFSLEEIRPSKLKPYFSLEKTIRSVSVYHSKTREFFKDLEIGLFAGPTLPSRTVSFNDANEITKNNVENEQLANTTTYGIRFSKRIRNVEFGLGVFQSEWRQTSNNIILQGEPSNNSISSYTDKIRGSTSIGDFTLNISSGAPIQPTLESGQFLLLPNILQEYQFLDIPVTASYYLFDKRFKLKLQLGINNRVLTNSSVQLQFPNGETEVFGDLQPEAYSLQFISGLGFSYEIGRRWSFNLLPSYFYGISPISIQEGATTRQHQLSILSGISYRL